MKQCGCFFERGKLCELFLSAKFISQGKSSRVAKWNCAVGFVEWNEGVTLAGMQGLGDAIEWNGMASSKPQLKILLFIFLLTADKGGGDLWLYGGVWLVLQGCDAKKIFWIW